MHSNTFESIFTAITFIRHSKTVTLLLSDAVLVCHPLNRASSQIYQHSVASKTCYDYVTAPATQPGIVCVTDWWITVSLRMIVLR